MISNWPGYIDPGDDNSLAEFTERTGIDVEYIEDINDNAAFFGKVQPQLEQGESGDRSIFVVTDWMAKQMYDLGYLYKLDHDDLPTVFENIRPGIRSTELDPDREFSIPWQSGMTGIWVDKAEAPDVTSINDLFDPKYKGRVTMMTEMRDTVPLVMKADGVDPAEATTEDWLAAIEKIREAADSGQIRRFTGNDYTEDITSGNSVASIGWSGDAYLISNPDAEWVMPDEGCMLWTDNMVIPVGAPNVAGRARVHELRLRAEGPGADHRLHPVRDAGRRRPGDLRAGGQPAGREPADLPRRRVHRRLHGPGQPAGREHRGDHLGVRGHRLGVTVRGVGRAAAPLSRPLT